MNLLVDELAKKGIEKEDVYNLFDKVNQVRFEEDKNYTKLKIEIIDGLRDWYLKVYPEDNYINPIYYQNILEIYRNKSNASSKYYFNSTKKDQIPTYIETSTTVFAPSNQQVDYATGEKTEVEEKTEYYDYYELDTKIVNGEVKSQEKRFLTKDDFNFSVDNIIKLLEEQEKTK